MFCLIPYPHLHTNWNDQLIKWIWSQVLSVSGYGFVNNIRLYFKHFWSYKTIILKSVRRTNPSESQLYPLKLTTKHSSFFIFNFATFHKIVFVPLETQNCHFGKAESLPHGSVSHNVTTSKLRALWSVYVRQRSSIYDVNTTHPSSCTSKFTI